MTARTWADASPLIAAAAAGFLPRLLELLGPVHITQIVADEIVCGDRPGAAAVRQEVRDGRLRVATVDAPPGRLGPGEASTIAAATGGDLVLLDDRDARAEARSRGLRVAGLLAVLVEGVRRGAMGAPEAIGYLDALAHGDFRMTAELYQWARQGIGPGRGQGV